MYNIMNQTLQKHTVTRVNIRSLQGRYPRYHGKNAVKGNHGYGRKIAVAVITTDSGIQGWGELCRPAGSDNEDIPDIIGKKVGELIHADAGILDQQLHSLDIALHDLAGRILNLPVSRMINPEAVSGIPIYDGAIYMNDLIDPAEPEDTDIVVRDCLTDYQMGYRAFKVKIGRGFQWMDHEEGLKRDIRIVNEIHKQLPDVKLLVDANDGYTYEDTIRFLDGIKGCPLYWIEEPFRENKEDLTRLKEYLSQHFPDTLIADGESMLSEPLLDELLEDSLVDVALPDICSYGFTPWRKRLEEMISSGYKGGPHAWGNMIKTRYCAHLAAAYPGKIPYVEGILGDTKGMDGDPYHIENGVLYIPQKPGFGMDLLKGKEEEL